jgi:hypothetical protein
MPGISCMAMTLDLSALITEVRIPDSLFTVGKDESVLSYVKRCGLPSVHALAFKCTHLIFLMNISVFSTCNSKITLSQMLEYMHVI